MTGRDPSFVHKQPQDENFILVEPLTPRELEVLVLLAERLSNAEIAQRLTLAHSTIKGYTREIYGKLAVNSRQAAVDRARLLGLLAETSSPQRPSDNLPAEITPFIGREREIEQIIRLVRSPSCRIVTLFGPGGVGKTRLAIHIARQLADQSSVLFPDGIFFVPLASVSKAAFIPLAILSALNIELEPGDDSHKQLIQFLKTKKLLLLLDNFEHLWGEESAGFLMEILSSAPAINLLITARERLVLHGEQSFSLPGLDVPTEEQLKSWGNTSAEAEKFSSIRLFIQSARRTQANFQLDPDQVPDLIEICRLLGGMPLGIEMAAVWVAVMSPTQILAEIRSRLEFLKADTYGIPKRQQRLTVVLESSWKRLKEAEKTAAKSLSVFQGSFDLPTAQKVFSFSPDLLRSLVNKSWLQPIQPGRFLMHALLNQFAGEQLAAEPELRRMIMDRYSQYYCVFLERLDADWSGPRQSAVIAEIEQEIDNIRAAWDWAAERHRIDLLARGRYSLETFYEWTGLQAEAESSFGKAVSSLMQQRLAQSQADTQSLMTLAQLLASQSHFTVENQAGISLLELAESILKQLEQLGLDVRSVRAQVLERYGQHWSLIDRIRAREYYEQSYSLYQELEDATSLSRLLNNLGWITWVTGDYERSRQLNQQNLKLQERRADRRGIGNTLDMLGLVSKYLGELDEAERLHRESVACMRRAGAERDVARLLIDLSYTLIWNGKFLEAIEKCEESRRIYEKLGLEPERFYLAMSFAVLHLGRYQQAEELALQEMTAAQASGHLQNYSFALLFAGEAALGLGKIDQSRARFSDSYTVMNSLQQNITVMPKIELGFVERIQGNHFEAWKCLQETFPSILTTRSFFPLLRSLPLIAVLLLDREETGQAIELYSLARCYEYVNASRWYQDLVGEKIDRQAANLPKERLTELVLRGKNLDLWQTAERLQAALPGWAAIK